MRKPSNKSKWLYFLLLLCVIIGLLLFFAVPRKIYEAHNIVRSNVSYTIINKTNESIEQITIGKYHSKEYSKRSPLVTLMNIGSHSTSVGMIGKTKDFSTIFITASNNGQEQKLIEDAPNEWAIPAYDFIIEIDSVASDGSLNGRYISRGPDKSEKTFTSRRTEGL